jgi:hypothetical protein
MLRFDAEVLVRCEDPQEDDCRSERPMKANVTALSEPHARRLVLERAWTNGLLVSRFLSIKQRRV